MAEKELFLSEIRICPECQLAATRRPELDTATQLAYRCPSHWHIVVFEAPPKVEPSKPSVTKRVAVVDTLSLSDKRPED